MTTVFFPKGTCSTKIELSVADDGTIEHVQFTGGCNGNTQGVSRLVEGMKAERAIAILQGINCKGKGTSCPDQLSKALGEALEIQNSRFKIDKIVESPNV